MTKAIRSASMKNRFLKILLLSVLFLLSACCLFACGDGSSDEPKKGLLMKKMGNDDTYTVYDYVDDGTLTDGVLDIASIAGDKVVSRIKANAFYGDDTVKKLIVPATVTRIDKGAFSNMKALEELQIPFVGYNANADTYYNETASAEDKAVDEMRTFGYMFGTDSYDFGQSATQTYGAGDSETFTYYFPTRLRKVIVAPANNYGIPMYAFYGNNGISSVVMGENVKAIGDYAFADAMYLSTIEIGANITRIGEGAFKDCAKLNNGLTFAADSTLTVIGDNAFENAGIERIALPASVTSIGSRAFKGSSVIEVDLGNVAKISSYAFYNCEKLEVVKTVATDIGAYAFYGCKSLKKYNYETDYHIDLNGVTSADAMCFAELADKVYTVHNKGSNDLDLMFFDTQKTE